MQEKVDVLMATYNGEKYIKEQVDSILNQTYKNIQLIISDDCSTDKTREILKQYEQNDNVKIFYQEKNLGYIKNFEFLLKNVESDLYMLSDQDDVWKEEKIEKSVEKLKRENLDLVFGDLEVVDENLNTIYESFDEYMKIDRKINKCIGSYKMQYLYNCITGCTILSKKKHLSKVLPLPATSKYMVHDYWIGLIVSLNGKIGYIKEKYIKYRQHGNNQVGTGKETYKFKKLEQVRNLFIDVKLGIFTAYVENEERFPEELKKQNKQVLEYYKMLKGKKNFNFMGWDIFYKLYKEEPFLYFIENFVILNMPFFARIAFSIRYKILKLLGKRK
ncbi:MAG: glycosyltransferase family 2 protein [Clostridia bacterium]|nr:glycosyltransferase family 2 protein [Clostridia bacterium]